jgi:hypothetical protein
VKKSHLLGQSRLIKKIPMWLLRQYDSRNPKVFYLAGAQQNLYPGDKNFVLGTKRLSQGQKCSPGDKNVDPGTNTLSWGQKLHPRDKNLCPGDKNFGRGMKL